MVLKPSAARAPGNLELIFGGLTLGPAKAQRITSCRLAIPRVPPQDNPMSKSVWNGSMLQSLFHVVLNLKAGKFRASTKYLFHFQSWASGSHSLHSGCLFSEPRCAYSMGLASIFPSSCFPHKCACSFLAIYLYPLKLLWGVAAVPSLIQVAITLYKLFSILITKACHTSDPISCQKW